MKHWFSERAIEKTKEFEMKQHTKGPWIVDGNGFENSWDISNHEGSLATVTSSREDAVLMATAPELFENFEKAIKLIDHIQTKYGLVHEVTIRNGYSLIAKIKGESK